MPRYRIPAPELTPEPPQTTGAAPPPRFRPGADRFQTAQSPPSPSDETLPDAKPRWMSYPLLSIGPRSPALDVRADRPTLRLEDLFARGNP